MNYKIAVPDNRVYEPLFRNKEISGSYNMQLYQVEEKKLREAMLNNRFDGALMSPLGYGLGVEDADYRIIPGPALAVQGWSEMASIYFRKGLKTISKVKAPSPDDFIMIIGKLLLAENFNMEPDVIRKNGETNELLKEADAVMTWEKDFHVESLLDITEEWFMAFELPLPLAFWVCREEEVPKNFEKFIHEVKANDLLKREDIVYEAKDEEFHRREGTILWEWNDDVEHALNQSIQFLYFHQLVPEIGAVKVLGRD